MPTLNDYNHFGGRHHVTGVIHNYLASIGITAPHTKGPYSEALLLGISGGIVMGYFTFAYEGYDPHVALLTRNTFNPLDTLLSRLGIEREFRKTNKPEKGVANLVDTLLEGVPAIVWADMWSLPYNALTYDKRMWGSQPLIVFAYEPTENQVSIADRASVPLFVTTEELMTARKRIKKDKFQIQTLDIPDPEQLPAAISSGIWDCIKLFTEKPPKGSAKNFGLTAYRNWIDLLTKPNQRLSWEKEFPAGSKMYAGLTSTFDHVGTIGIRGDADRALYADFLDEAAIILNKTVLRESATLFRQSAKAWRKLGSVLLPDEVPQFKEAREIMTQRSQRFVDQGGAALSEMNQINQRLKALRCEISSSFPLTAAEVQAHRNLIAEQIQIIHDIEQEAITHLRTVMSD